MHVKQCSWFCRPSTRYIATQRCTSGKYIRHVHKNCYVKHDRSSEIGVCDKFKSWIRTSIPPLSLSTISLILCCQTAKQYICSVLGSMNWRIVKIKWHSSNFVPESVWPDSYAFAAPFCDPAWAPGHLGLRKPPGH